MPRLRPSFTVILWGCSMALWPRMLQHVHSRVVMNDCKPRPAKLDVKESGKPVVEFAVLAVPYTGLAGPGLAA